MVRGEQVYRMRGAVTLEERRSRTGHYYTVYWNTAEVAQGGQIVFEYQQAITASDVLTKTFKIPTGHSSGSAEFNIIGKEYQQGGNVLAWRARLVKGGKTLAVKRSYLWR